jgi:hypothetical protein
VTGHRNHERVRALAAEEIRAWVDDINAKMAALERRWKESGQTDLHALHGALVFCETQLPAWLFSGLCRVIETQLFQQPCPPYHEFRWAMVRECLADGLTHDEAYDEVAEKLADTDARCGCHMVMKSYQKVEGRLPDWARWRNRKQRRKPKRRLK